MSEDIFGIAGASGQTALVKDGGVQVNPRTDFDQAVLDGLAFSWGSLDYDPDAHDTILGVQNSSSTHVLKIHKLIFSSDTASQIQVFRATGVTMTGTAVVGVNLNGASGRVPEATAKADETNNGEQAAPYTAKIMQKQVAADTPVEILLDGGIILGEGDMVGVDLTTAATAANATFIGWFEPR